MHRFLRFLWIAGMVGLMAGCSMTDLMEGLDDGGDASAQTAQTGTTENVRIARKNKQVAEKRLARPKSELDQIAKIAVVQEYGGSGMETSYISSAPITDIVPFYRGEMPRHGWQETHAQSDNQNYATMKFSRGKELVTLTLSRDSENEPPRVTVTLTYHGSVKVGELPRYPGVKTLFAEEYTAIYVTPDPPDKVHSQTLRLLAKDGWVAPPGATAVQDQPGLPYSKATTLRKGGMELNVHVTVAPAQNNQTTIQYNMRKMAKGG